jgi:hypothetical protein
LNLRHYVDDLGKVTLLALLDPGQKHAPELLEPEADFREWTEIFGRLTFDTTKKLDFTGTKRKPLAILMEQTKFFCICRELQKA